MNDGMFSSTTPEWDTPQDFFDRYDEKYHFTLDAASTDNNAKCHSHFTLHDDGLSQNWGGADGMAESALWKRDREMGTESL